MQIILKHSDEYVLLIFLVPKSEIV